jgi:hypothetical protein
MKDKNGDGKLQQVCRSEDLKTKANEKEIESNMMKKRPRGP